MNQIKKRLLYGILIGLAVGIIGIVVVIIVTNNTVKGYKEGTNADFLANYTGYVVTFTRDVVQGETITSDMLTTTRVHKNTMPATAVTNTGAIVGMIAKYNIPKNVTVVNSMFSDHIVESDVRIQEVSAILLPTKVVVGDFVDIRLQVPSGIEYIVLPQKQILDISGTTIWLELSEEELLTLNSAIVDSYMTNGSKLYAVQYADPTTQIKVDEQAEEQARLYLVNKIKDEIAGIDIGAITAPVTAQEETTEETIEGTPEETNTVTPSISAADTLVDLVTTYAIEYRYYVESYSKADKTYQPNATVINFMKNHKDIVQTAKDRLSLETRTAIEAEIASFNIEYEQSYSSVVSGIEASKSTQQTLRSSVLGQ